MVIYLVYSSLTMWLFSLAAINRTPRIVDTLMWVIPFFISSRIKPYLLSYAKSSTSTISSFLKMVIFSYGIIVIGEYFIMISIEPQRMLEITDLTDQYHVKLG